MSEILFNNEDIVIALFKILVLHCVSANVKSICAMKTIVNWNPVVTRMVPIAMFNVMGPSAIV